MEVNANSNPAVADPAQDPNSPEYAARMAAIADGQEPAKPDTEADTGQRPAWLPEKFKSPEDLAKAYEELQKKLGQGDQQGAEAGSQEADTEADTDAQEAADKAVQQAGLDMGALETEVLENGTLSDKSFEALEKAGISRQMAEQYIEGQRALGEAVQQRLTDHVGGKEQLNAMLTWAKDSLPRDEAEAFNAMVSGSEAQAKIALDGLKAKYVAANGQQPKLIGGNRGANAVPGYASFGQLQKDMSDSRYATDQAFRAEVEAKIARSSLF